MQLPKDHVFQTLRHPTRVWRENPELHFLTVTAFCSGNRFYAKKLLKQLKATGLQARRYRKRLSRRQR